MQWTNADMTDNFKLIASALNLNRADVSEILTLGGFPASRSQADKLLRGAGSTKNATGNSDLAGTRINRTDTIKPDQFRAFCAGLKPWLDRQLQQE